MRVLIIGGGFGGVKTALQLARDASVSVTLISDKDHFVYYPTLYSVATGGAQRQSFVPLSHIFKSTTITFIQDTIVGYDPHRRLVRGHKKQYSYDRVVFALGVVTSYFGIQGLETYSFGIKSHHEVSTFRRHLHDELTATRKIDKQYVIVGAGATGVELASSLAHYIDHIARAHLITHSRIRIKLVEAAPRVLPRMSPRASQVVEKRLKAVGVSVMTNEKVEWQDDDEVFVSGQSIPTHTVVWTSGVANNPFFENHNQVFALSPNKRVLVDEHLMVEPRTYVIGDNAFTPHAGLAQTALRDAHFVARDILRTIKNRPRVSYRPKLPPVVIPVGKRWALLEYGSFRIHGYMGHLIRRAADFIGYHDVLPLRLAIRMWLAESEQEDSCRLCKNSH